jgi:hypothetical protein
MYLKFTDRSMNIYMPHRKRKKTTAKAKLDTHVEEEDDLRIQYPWVHVNNAAKIILFQGEKVSKVYVKIYSIHGSHQGQLDQVEEWIKTHHPNCEINWYATKQYIEHIKYWSR